MPYQLPIITFRVLNVFSRTCLIYFAFLFRLGYWVSTQRAEYKKFQAGETSGMTAERIQRLEAEGFVWNQLDDLWDTRFSELEEYKQEHGHCNVPKDKPE